MKKISLSLLLVVILSVGKCFSQDGIPDVTFGNKGIVKYNIAGSGGVSEAIQSDGRILVASGSQGVGFVVLRYNIDGTLDNSFGSAGVTVANDSYYNYTTSVGLEPNGKIMVGGTCGAITLARFNMDGSLDYTFNNSGFVNYTSDCFEYSECAMIVQSDGKTVQAGSELCGASYMDENSMIIRRNYDGTVDSSFGVKLYGYSTYFTCMSSLGDTGILMGGTGIFGILFEIDEARMIDIDDYSIEGINAVATDTRGKIIAAGADTSDLYEIMKFNTGLTPDSSFGKNGFVSTPFPVNSIMVQPDNKIVIAGEDSLYSLIMRYNANGTPDSSFGKNGLVVDSVLTYNNEVIMMKDGRILVASYNANGITLACYTSGLDLGIKNLGYVKRDHKWGYGMFL